MKRITRCLGITMAFGLAGLANTALSQDWSDDFESYSDGQVLYHVGGWSGWDDVEAVAGSCTTAHAHSGTKALLDEGADDAIQTFDGLTSGSGTITAWTYIPVSQFIADAWFLVQNEYAHGGPYQWCIQLGFDFEGDLGGGPGTVGDPDRTETNFPPIQFDQWVEVRCEVDIDNDTLTTYYNNIEVSTGQLFARGGAHEIKNLDLYTTGTTVYYDDCAVLGLGSGGGGYTCEITGTCPGNIDVNWSGAQPNKTQGIVFASNTGSFTINSGACAGTQLGLGTRNLQLVRTIGTGSGAGSIGRAVGAGACGGFVQLVTVASPCEASSVGQIP